MLDGRVPSFRCWGLSFDRWVCVGSPGGCDWSQQLPKRPGETWSRLVESPWDAHKHIAFSDSLLPSSLLFLLFLIFPREKTCRDGSFTCIYKVEIQTLWEVVSMGISESWDYYPRILHKTLVNSPWLGASTASWRSPTSIEKPIVRLKSFKTTCFFPIFGSSLHSFWLADIHKDGATCSPIYSYTVIGCTFAIAR